MDLLVIWGLVVGCLVASGVEGVTRLLGVDEVDDFEFLFPGRLSDRNRIAVNQTDSTCKCKWVCRVQRRCNAATFSKSAINGNRICTLGMAVTISSVLHLVPSNTEMTLVTDFGRKIIPWRLAKFFGEKEIGGNPETKYHYSFLTYKYIYWLLKKKLTYQESIDECAKHPHTHLAYVTNSKEMNITEQIMVDDRDGIPKDRFDRHYVHVYMHTGAEGEVYVKENTLLDTSTFHSSAYFETQDNDVMYLIVKADGSSFGINDFPDEPTFALCKSLMHY